MIDHEYLLIHTPEYLFHFIILVNVCEDLQFEELPNNLKEKIRIHNKELDKDLLRESHKRV